MTDLLQIFKITYNGQPYNPKEYPGSAANALGTALARRHIWFRWVAWVGSMPEKVFYLIASHDSLSEIENAIKFNELDKFQIEPFGEPILDCECVECSGSGTIDDDGPTHFCKFCNGTGSSYGIYR
jgi:hypothetical protein